MLNSEKKFIFILSNAVAILQLIAFAIALMLSLRSTNIHYLTIDNRNMNATAVYSDEIDYNMRPQWFNVSDLWGLPSYTINDTTLEPYYRLYLKKYCAGSNKAGGGWENSKCFDWTTDNGIDEIYNSQNTDDRTNVKVFVNPSYRHSVRYFFDRTTESRRMITYISGSIAVCTMITAIVTVVYMLFVWLLNDDLHWFWRFHIFLLCFATAIESVVVAIFARRLSHSVRAIVGSRKTKAARLRMTDSNDVYILVIIMVSVLLISFALSGLFSFFMKQLTTSRKSNDATDQTSTEEQTIDLDDLSISKDSVNCSKEVSSVGESTKPDPPPAYVKGGTSPGYTETLSS